MRIFAIVLLSAVVGTFAYNEVASVYLPAVAQYNQELACVDAMLSRGHERINIGMSDGSCFVAPNAYYGTN